MHTPVLLLLLLWLQSAVHGRSPLWTFEESVERAEWRSLNELAVPIHDLAKNREAMMMMATNSSSTMNHTQPTLRRKSRHHLNQAFPAEVFENVCLEFTTTGTEPVLRGLSSEWAERRGSTTLVLFVDGGGSGGATDASTPGDDNTDDDENIARAARGEAPKHWPAVDASGACGDDPSCISWHHFSIAASR